MSRSKRIGLSKRIRFEVLKRDKFACQYCGAKAPDVLLHIDHISPVANGGKNELANLITSCVGCNLGKGARLISDDSAVAKQRIQLEELQARKEQLEMMSAWQNSLIDLDAEALKHAAEYYSRLVPGWSLSEGGLAQLRAPRIQVWDRVCYVRA